MSKDMIIKSNDYVRTATGVEGSNTLYFIAYDVARVLGFQDTEYAVVTYCYDVNMQPNISISNPNKFISLIGIEDVKRLMEKAPEHKAWAFEYWLSQRMELGGSPLLGRYEPSNVLDTKPHDFHGSEVRTVQLEIKSNENRGLDLGCQNTTPSNETYFVARDVAVTLGYTDVINAIKAHCKYVKKAKIFSGGKTREVSIIKQSDVFRLVMRSKLPQAEAFQDWVVEVVLPSIQKTGSYSMGQSPKTVPSKIDLLKDHIITESARLLLEADNKALKAQALLDAPKVEFHDEVSMLSGDISVRKAAQTLNTGQNRLMAWLRANHWVCGNNVPMQSMINAGFLSSNVSSYEHPDLGLSDRVVTRITPLGLIELSKHKIP